MPDQSVGNPAGAGLLQRPSADDLVSTTTHSYRPDDACTPGLFHPDSRWPVASYEAASRSAPGPQARHVQRLWTAGWTSADGWAGEENTEVRWVRANARDIRP